MDNLRMHRLDVSYPGRLPGSVRGLITSTSNPYLNKSLEVSSQISKLHKSSTKDSQPPTVMVILDGWGYRENFRGNAIADAKTPVMDRLMARHPSTLLNPKGMYIGDPNNLREGNSEDGHVTIGSGRAVPNLPNRISTEIKDGNFFKNSELIAAVNHVKDLKLKGLDSKFNLMGLVSTNSSHAQLSHMDALIKLARDQGLEDADIKLNLIVDGRDDPPGMARRVINRIQEKYPNIEITSITGRDIAMDRNNNDSKTSAFFRALTESTQFQFDSPRDALDTYFAVNNNKSEEFMPTFITSKSERVPVSDKDSLVFFNTRPDRAKQIALKFQKMDEKEHFRFTTLGDYDLKNVSLNVAYKKQPVLGGLMQVLNDLGMKVKKIAESEKAAHVGYFFNGGTNKPFTNESREIIPSLKVADYSETPEMKSEEIANATIKSLANNGANALTVVNFAAPDMVGHTGKMSAVKDAVSIVDKQLGRIVDKVKSLGGKLIVTADHGNADMIRDSKGRKLTGHSDSPVPFIVADFSKKKSDLKLRFNNDDNSLGLSNIAATVLELLGVDVPEYMDESLIDKSKSSKIWWPGWRTVQQGFNEMPKYTDQPISRD